MKKVFIIHGFEGRPNGGWRPWFMSELEKISVYACALPMPSPESPVCSEWIDEISRHVKDNNDEIYLVGHSLGVPAILRFLEKIDFVMPVRGVVLVSGPLDDVGIKEIADFFTIPFDFETIKKKACLFTIIHGDDDDVVPVQQAKVLAGKLNGELIIIPNGGHLTGSAGWYQLPQLLEATKKMFDL